MKMLTQPADVCLILEGTYPYVLGGVSSWAHDLITAQSHLRFCIVSLLAGNQELKSRYELPANVVGVEHLYLRQLPKGEAGPKKLDEMVERLEEPLLQLHARGGLADFRELLQLIQPWRDQLGCETLLNSRAAWNLLLRMYKKTLPQMPFMDYFWSWRALIGGLFSILLAEFPSARVYHTVSTGYAGLLAARASLETRRPVILTEHGIYTNERRIDIAMSGWPYEPPYEGYQIGTDRRDLKRLWIDSFIGYSRVCYRACTHIITLYRGNQQLQIEDGADPSRMRIIPNGIDYQRYAAIARDKESRPPTIALIGRVVPIKDVMTFIRACSLLRESIPNLRAWVLGPTEEDKDYFRECQSLVEQLGLQPCVSFLGKVRLDEHLGKIDVIVLTSLSEAQPLVILEAGAAGIPSVATNVGACSELILGGHQEKPPLGPGGAITSLANPAGTAEALRILLTNAEWYQSCSRNARERVRTFYNRSDLDGAYRKLYADCCNALEAAPYDLARAS